MTTYYVADHLGSSRLILSGFGYPVWSGVFLPFGQESNPQMTMNTYKFTGDERDSETNLDHTWFRQYEATQGRWLTPDPYMGSMDLTNPQSLNRYAYVNNVPVNAIDSDGLKPDYPRLDLPALDTSNTGWTSLTLLDLAFTPTAALGYIQTDEGGDIVDIGIAPYYGNLGALDAIGMFTDTEVAGDFENARNSRYHCPLFRQCYEGKAPHPTAAQQKCINDFLSNNYSTSIGQKIVPNFSLYSFLPGSPNRSRALASSGEAVLVKGTAIVGGNLAGRVFNFLGATKAGSFLVSGSKVVAEGVGALSSEVTVFSTAAEARAREACGAEVF